jgi:hypothetical protein
VISEDTGQRILSSWVNKVLLKVGRKYSSFKESTATEKQWAENLGGLYRMDQDGSTKHH